VSRFKGKVRGRAKGVPNGPNKTELAYGKVLEAEKLKGEVLEYGYEGVKLKLADNTWYTPDYWVITKTLEFELHEVKAAWKVKGTQKYKPHWEAAGRIKIKVAAEKFPHFKFIGVAKTPTEWLVEEF